MARALVFPGQGAQKVGMGAALAEKFPLAREILAEADEVLGFACSKVIAEGPEEELTRTDVSQPAILVVSWMAYRVLESELGEVAFDAAAGLSLGEYTALVAAGSIAFADAVRLVRLRGEAMQAASDAGPSGMVALIGTDEDGARALCDAVADGEVCQVANLNSPGQVVISGAKGACERAVAAAKDRGIRRAMPLPVAGAFHSALMAPAAERLEEAIAETAIADAGVPVYANVSAAPVTDAETIAANLVAQLTEPVRWADSVAAMHAAGIGEFWEFGPGTTLSGMIARIAKDAATANLQEPNDLAKFATSAG